MKNKISKSLQETVQEHEHIDQVHFDAKGNHYLNVHEFKYEPKKTDDKETRKKGEEANGLYGRIHVKNVVNNDTGSSFQIKYPIVTTKIVESVDREDILKAEPVSDLSINFGSLSEAEQAAVMQIRYGKKENISQE